MKKVAILAILILLAPTVATSAIFQSSNAQTFQTKLKVVPQENIFYTNTTSVGNTFTISIIAENIVNQEGGMYGWEFWLYWTPGIINCTKEEINYRIWPSYNGPWIADPIDNEAGTYHQSLTARAPSQPVTGTYWLVNLTFQIVKAPLTGGTLQTQLDIEPPSGMTYCLVDKYAGEIPHEYINGIYKFVSPRPPMRPIALKVNPPAIFDPSKVPSQKFNVSITVTNAAYLHGFILNLSYNSTIIECQQAYEGNFLRNYGPTRMMYQINNPLGFTRVSINLTDPTAMAEGNGTLAILEFHILNFGGSILHLFETQLYDPEGSPLFHTTSDGYFSNILIPKLLVDPKEIVDPSMKPGSKFEIDIKVANVSNLYDFEFKLTYDTKVLNGLGVIIYPFGNETSFDFELTLNDPAGFIWVRVQYYPPAEPLTTTEPLSLATIFFQVQSYGATPLHFQETELSDPQGAYMTHITQDGYVSVLRRDVAIISISPSVTEVYKGWKLNITITAKNLGDVPETFNVTAYCDTHKIGTLTITNLAPNATATLNFMFDTLQSWIEPCHNYIFKAEASIVPYELDVTNNILIDGQIHIKLMGDINGDGYVNILDAVILGTKFGLKTGDPGWDPNADLNQDGYINVKDVILLGMNFGAHCS